MIHTDTKILSLAAALLLCFGTYALAAPPEGKGKPPKGNQPVDATAEFSGDIMSSGLVDGRLQGELVDNGGFDTMKGQLLSGEEITIGGDAGGALQYFAGIPPDVLPADPPVLPAAGVDVQYRMVTFDVDSGVTWTIRLDRDKEPPNRVQFKMRWLNVDGFERHLRIGWVVQAYEDEIYPLPDSEYGEVADGDTSLESATVTFDADFFRIDGDVVVPSKGKKTKTEQEVFSQYGELYDATVAPWCAMGGTLGELLDPDSSETIYPCRESTTIQTALVTTD
ncbi:MAG: hypothetical protein IIA05_08580 [Proteobacteria bacterium]|nr:hypothetical protein [Pseudomonadota bacterium]